MNAADPRDEQLRLAKRFDDLCIDMDYDVLAPLDAWSIAMAHVRLDAILAEGPAQQRALTARLSVEGLQDLLDRWRQHPGLAALVPRRERELGSIPAGKEAARRKVEQRLASISEKARQSAERRRMRLAR